jgi:hypothetical protein
MNPQILNRYSYCLNNPLKYTDPSGHEVYIGGFNVEVMNAYLDNYQNYYDCWDLSQAFLDTVCSPLYEAYYDLRSVAPELTNNLEAATQIINIQMGDPGILAGGSTVPKPGGDIDITIANEKGDNIATIASKIGHEGFHSAVWIGLGLGPKSSNFAANEAFAYSFGYAVGQELGAAPDRISTAMSDINPSIPKNKLDGRIDDAGRFLHDNHPAYFRQTWLQKWITGGSSPLLSWSPEDKIGDRFLTVAKSVWIR